MYRRKRKATDDNELDPDGGDRDERMMSASPSNSPAMSSRPTLSPYRSAAATSTSATTNTHAGAGAGSGSSISGSSSGRSKRLRSNFSAGRPLTVPRLLEMLDASAMRSMLQAITERHPELTPELVSLAPPPTVNTALSVLGRYEANMRAAFPYGSGGGGSQPGSDYAYNRVRPALLELLDSLSDFTPHFLPPHETRPATSLEFLDGATAIVHRLPVWSNAAHNFHKNLAYEEIAKAWALVIREAAKKGAGMQLQYGGWDQKLAKHHEQSQGRMGAAMQELGRCLDWMGGGGLGNGGGSSSDTLFSPSRRQQYQQQPGGNGYGSNMSVRIGSW